jgi:RNA polymerase sigma-B factor
MQVGCVGLLKACKTYDPNREGKASFKTFAVVYIKGEIRHYLRDHGSLVQMPRRLNDISSKLNQIEESLTHELERPPTAEELSMRSGFSVQDVREAQHSWEACSHFESLDASEESEGREDTRVMCEMVPDRRHIDAQSHAEDREVVAQALKNVGERTRQIIEFVYFYDLTQKEAAQLLGLSEMGVSRTLRRAMAKLKDILFTEIF